MKTSSPTVCPRTRRDGHSCHFGQPQLDMSATEWRKMVAHGVSRGEPCALAKSPVSGDRVGSRRTFFRRFALKLSIPKPTADAVGHPLAAAPQLSTPAIKTDLPP